MTDQSIFGNEQKQEQQQVQNTNNSNPLDTLLAGIKNESGVQKYANVEEALRGAAHAQDFIATLKREKEDAERKLAEAQRIADESRGQLSKQDELERTVRELTQKFSEQSTPTSGQQFTPEQIAELVNRTLTERDTANTSKQNQTLVVNELKKKFGEKAEEAYVAAAAELGLSVAEMNNLAAKSPKAVLKALGVSGQQAQPKTSAPFQSAINTAGFNPSQETFVKRNDKKLEVGATFHDMQEETRASKRMVEELHAQGLEIADLINPKEYFKIFK